MHVNAFIQAQFHMCMNMYEIQAYTGTGTHTHRYKSPSSREKERKLGCEEMTQRCRCVLLDRSSLPLLSFFFPLLNFDILMDLSSGTRKKAGKSKGMVKLCYCTLSESLRLMLLSETQLQVFPLVKRS